MTYPVQETLLRGQTLALEFRFRGEDLSDSVPRVEVSSGLSGGLIEVSRGGVDTIFVRCPHTVDLPLGRHSLELWLDWPPSYPVVHEFALIVFVTVVGSEGME